MTHLAALKVTACFVLAVPPCTSQADSSVTQTNAPDQTERDRVHEFDFWIGEWDVLNRFLTNEGTWRDADRTRARITPVVGGRAILEEWAGPYRGTFMNGFSLRSWNPRARRWEVLLFWTTNGNGSFGLMPGNFRHGRCELLSSTTSPERTRYTFSDALSQTVRWDRARTSDAGQTWKTDWIMEFSRTHARSDTTIDRFFKRDWTPGKLSPHDEARSLDGMIGEWAGTQTGPEGQSLEARLRCKLISKDCLLVDLLETRAPNGRWSGRLCVRGFTMPAKSWESWRTEEPDQALRKYVSVPSDTNASSLAVFEHVAAGGGTRDREHLKMGPNDALVITEVQIADGAEPVVVRETRLRKKP